MIYDSISMDNKENSICVLTDKCDDDGNPIIIIITNSIQDNKYHDVKMAVIKIDASNHIDSMYGKEDFYNNFIEVIDNNADI